MAWYDYALIVLALLELGSISMSLRIIRRHLTGEAQVEAWEILADLGKKRQEQAERDHLAKLQGRS